MSRRMSKLRNLFPYSFLVTTVLVSLYVYLMWVDDSTFRLPLQSLPNFRWCKNMRLSTIFEKRNAVGLVSYPGSGSTWLRYLLQQATGIATGSVYFDANLFLSGFPGENINSGAMLVVKSHENITMQLREGPFDSVVLLIREPGKSILSSFNYEYSELRLLPHAMSAPPSEFKKPCWVTRFSEYLSDWKKLYKDWLTNYHGPIHIVFYENLVTHTRNELQAIIDFLNFTFPEGDITCAIERQNDLDHNIRRIKKFKYFDPFTKDMYKQLELAKKKVYALAKNYQAKKNLKRHNLNEPEFHFMYEDMNVSY